MLCYKPLTDVQIGLELQSAAGNLRLEREKFKVTIQSVSQTIYLCGTPVKHQVSCSTTTPIRVAGSNKSTRDQSHFFNPLHTCAS